MKHWMLVAEPLDFENPLHGAATIDWNRAHAYDPENRYWTRFRAALAGTRWVSDPAYRGLRFRVMRVRRD